MTVKTKDEVVDILRTYVDTHKFVDVGYGSEKILGISRYRFNSALLELEMMGYSVERVTVAQLKPNGYDNRPSTNFTILKVLTTPEFNRKTAQAVVLNGTLRTLRD